MNETAYVAECRYQPNDTLTVESLGDDTDGPEILLGVEGGPDRYISVYLTPKKARLLAKAIKKAAKRAEKAADQ